MMKKNLLLICLFAWTSTWLYGQDIQSFIPLDANMVMQVHAKNLNQKTDFAAIQQLEFYDMMLQEMTRGLEPDAKQQMYTLMTTPSQLGLNLNEDFCFFARMIGEEQFFGMAFRLSDPAAWEKLLVDRLAGMPEYERLGLADQTVWMNAGDNLSFGWNGTVGIIAGGSLKVDFEQTWGYTEEDWDLWEVQQATALDNWGKSLLEKSFGPSLAGNAQFKKASTTDSDLHLWLDYGAIMESSLGTMMGTMGVSPGMMSGSRGMMEGLMSLYDDMKMSMHLTFDPGALQLTSQLFASDKLLDMYKGAVKSKVNKRLAQYVAQDEMLAYLSMNYNVEKTVEGVKSLLRDMMAETPEYGPMALGGMDLLEIIIDEKALYELFEGDALFAMTGLESFERTVITYEYDENFNATEVEKVVTEQLPEFVLAASYGNQENLMKLVNFGINSKALVPQGNYYSLNVPDLPMEVFLALHDGVLLLTNNTDLVQNRLERGYSKGEQLSKDHRKRLKKNAQVIFWDIPKTIGLVEELGLPIPTEANTAVEKIQGQIGNLIVTVPSKVGDSIDSGFTLQMQNPDINFLEQFFTMMDELIMEMMGGEKS